MGPRTGNSFAWLGGYRASTPLETDGSYLVQEPVLSSGGASLRFWLWNGATSNSEDYVQVAVDGAVISGNVNGASVPELKFFAGGPLLGPGYNEITADLAALGYADNAPHLVRIEGLFSGSPGASNFALDDISLCSAPPVPTSTPTSTPTRTHTATKTPTPTRTPTSTVTPTATPVACAAGNVQQVENGGFEDGSNGWTISSLHNYPIICGPDCGGDSYVGPRTGTGYAWIGGHLASGNDPDEELVSQDVILTDGAATLCFWLWNGVSANTSDFVQVFIDETPIGGEVNGAPVALLKFHGATPLLQPGYNFITANLGLLGFADNQSHSLRIEGWFVGTPRMVMLSVLFRAILLEMTQAMRWIFPILSRHRHSRMK